MHKALSRQIIRDARKLRKEVDDKNKIIKKLQKHDPPKDQEVAIMYSKYRRGEITKKQLTTRLAKIYRGHS